MQQIHTADWQTKGSPLKLLQRIVLTSTVFALKTETSTKHTIASEHWQTN